MKLINWKQNYFTMLTGQGISLITSGILQMAIIFYITEKTGSALVLSMATLVGFLPQAIFGPFIGVYVDRLSRKAVMMASDLVIAFAAFVLAVIATLMELPIWAIFIVLFVRSVGTAFHSPAVNASTQQMVPEEHLTKCAGYSQAVQSISAIISPALGALLYANVKMNYIISLDIIGALLASITILYITIPELSRNELIESHVFKEMKEGYLVLKEHKGLMALLLIGTGYTFIYMPISALFPLMSMGYFMGTATHASIAEIAFALGMLVGGIILGIWGGFKRRTLTIGLSILIMGLSLVGAGLLPSSGFVVFVVSAVIMGLTAPFYGVQTALFQEKIEPEYLGRVFALLGSVMSLAMPLGLVMSGLFAETLGVNHWFFISGILITGLSIFVFTNSSIKMLNH